MRRTKAPAAALSAVVGLFVLGLGVVVFVAASRCERAAGVNADLVVCSHGGGSFTFSLLAHRVLLVTVAVVLLLQLLLVAMAVANANLQMHEDGDETAAEQATLVRAVLRYLPM